jgi:hypothetical protein
VKKRTRPVLPWAALIGLGVSGSALALFRFGIVHREDLLLGPTYQLLRLDAWRGGSWTITLFFLGVQAFIWFLLAATVAVGFRVMRTRLAITSREK